MKGGGVCLTLIAALGLTPGAQAFFATSLSCCEDKCAAQGLGIEATAACKMHGCMQRWNGEGTSMCAARCMDRSGTVNKEACLQGCKGFDACNCGGGSYFSKPSAWADATAAQSCAPCPAGFACAGVQAQPAKCGAGEWAHADASACSACSAGRYGTGGSQGPQCSGPCAAGRFGREGARTMNCHGGCVVAPGRYARVAGSEVSCSAACPAGRFGTGDSQSSACSGACKAGTYSASGAAACDKCPAGTFGAVAGAQNQMCSGLCAAGTYSDAGATVCVDAGEYKPPTTTTEAGGKTAVTNHLGGTMNTIRGQTGVTSCDEGARRVCTTNTACQLAGEPISCPLTAQFKGHYVRLITSACVCDAVPTPLAPVALAPKDRLKEGQCLNGAKVVEDQWSGVGAGTEWCNHCMCTAGKLICTTLSCGATTTAPAAVNATAAPQAQIGKTCVNGGAIVQDGWMGRGTNSKWCKMCVCQAAVSVYTVCSQNECTDAPATTPAPTKLDWMTMCKRGTSFVRDGWTGKGLGEDWCNMCTCSKTRMSCTKMACGANPNVCMNGHAPVPYGWVGTGKGAQWCNQCRCTKESFVCTPKICGDNPDEVATLAPTAAPKLDANSCDNSGVKVADGWHGPAAGDAYCNVCTCKAGALTCTKQACPPKERPECKLVICPQVAPACLARATLPVPKRDFAGCCFDPSKDCAAATTVTTFTGEYTAAAPFLNNGGEALVVKSEAECHEQCLQSSACLAGTYIISGPHVGECWLSANVHTKELTCDKPCRSFAKRLGPAKGGWLTTKAPTVTGFSVPVPPSAHQRDLKHLNSGAKAFGNACKCNVHTAPASKLVACHADLLGSGHIRVRHLSPRFNHWETVGNEGHTCRLVRDTKNSEGGGSMCARRDMAGGCEKWENFACHCCDCTSDGVPALLTMLPRAGYTMIAAGAPLLTTRAASGGATPTCAARKGSVWAMCGDTEVKKWGIGPEGEATAIKNCNWASAKKDCHWQAVGDVVPHTLESCMEECTTDIRCMVGEFVAATEGLSTCKLSARVGSPAPCGSGCHGFTKRHLRPGTDTVAVAKTTVSALEVASLGASTVVRLDASKGTYRAVEPYLTGGPVKMATLEACQTKCAEDAKCLYGTFITAGVNADQCWLSEFARATQSLLCASPCQSFSKGRLVDGQVNKPLLMP